MNGYTRYYHQGLEVIRLDVDGRGNETRTREAVGEDWQKAWRISVLLNAAITWDVNAIEAGRITFQPKPEEVPQ